MPVYGIVIEAQLAPDERKSFVWPVYAVNLRARLELPVCTLVVTVDEATARWAAKPVDLGGGNSYRPLVLGPAGVPEVDRRSAGAAWTRSWPFSRPWRTGRMRTAGKPLQIALAAQLASLGLDEDRARIYFDLVLASLGEAARRELRAMDPAKYEYQSDFAKRYVAQGRAEGRAQAGRGPRCARAPSADAPIRPATARRDRAAWRNLRSTSSTPSASVCSPRNRSTRRSARSNSAGPRGGARAFATPPVGTPQTPLALGSILIDTTAPGWTSSTASSSSTRSSRRAGRPFRSRS